MPSSSFSSTALRPHPPASPRLPARCPFCNARNLTRQGQRTLAGEPLAVVACRTCGKRFSNRARQMARRQYPDRHILEALQHYCRGHTYADTAWLLNDRYGYGLNKGTVHRWVERYGHHLTYTRLRESGRDFHPANILLRHRFNHRQAYHYACHAKKLELAVAGDLDPRVSRHVPVENLAGFLCDIQERVRGVDFDAPEVVRASQLRNTFIDRTLSVSIEETPAVASARLVIPTVSDNTERHPRLQEFMLTTDDATLGVEVPLWLTPADIGTLDRRHGIDLLAAAPPSRTALTPVRAITGHADILQLRKGKVHILDYKPGARHEKPYAQLTLYALALTCRVPGLSIMDIRCTWFDENQAYAFSPRDALHRDGLLRS